MVSGKAISLLVDTGASSSVLKFQGPLAHAPIPVVGMKGLPEHPLQTPPYTAQ